MAAGKRKPAGLATHSATRSAKHSKTETSRADPSDESMASSDGSDAESDVANLSDDSDEEMDGADEPKLAGENGDGKGSRTAGHKKTATNAEIMALNEASLLFKSNLFKLQIDELLGETQVQPNTKATRDLDAALKQIRDVLAAMESTKEMTVDAATNYVRKLSKQATGIPFPDPAPPAGLALKLAFAAPEVVNVVGSYALGMAVRTQSAFNVDVLAQMPARLFQERDYMNYRYFYKRAFFVAMVRVHLQRSVLQELFDIEYELLRSDTRLPVVVLRPKRDTRLGRLGCVVRIQPSIAPDTLPLRRLTPDRNHVRTAFVGGADTDADADEEPATPQYNAAVVSDALQLTHMKYLFETGTACGEFGRAAALLRVWLAQRTARQAGALQLMAPRMGGFALTMVLAWLVRSANSGGVTGARLSNAMDAHQLFKGAIEFLASHDFADGALQFGTEKVGADMSGSAAVLMDPSASVNVLSGVAAWELAELRLHAQQTARDLNHHSASNFARVFLSAALADVTAKYDHVFRLDVDLASFLTARFGSGMDVAQRQAELEHGHPAVAAQHRIAQLLGAALARQTRLVAVHAGADAAFDDCTKAVRRHVFVIGVVLGADARRLVDLGPSPDAQPQDAARFRELWGDKAELRRFRDSSIRLATVWGANTMPMEQRALIVPRMLAFLLRRHFAVRAQPELLRAEDQQIADGQSKDQQPAGHLFCLSARIADFASTRDLSASDADRITFEAAISGFDQFQRDVKALEDRLPLRVLALHAVSPGLRYASLAPPKPLALAQGRGDDAFVEPLHVLVEFTTSNKWPDDVTALHKVKSAFLLRLAECYADAHPGTHIDVASRFFGYGASDGLLVGASPTRLASSDDFDYERDSFVDIRHAQSGLTFRLSVLCDPEGALLARKAQEMQRAKLAPQADALLRAHRRWARTTQWRAMHHRQILDLCQRHHPAASLTIRLLKRWLSRHMLLGQPVGVPEETAELIAARVFTDTWNGLAVPGSAYAGFVRCLQLLAEWRWTEDLCLVDFSTATSADDDNDASSDEKNMRVWNTTDGLSADAYAKVQAVFDDAVKRKQLRGGLRIATAEDPDASRWGTVSPVLTRRLRALARASLHAITQCVATGSDAALPQVFTTPLADYDFVIKLDPDLVCRQYEQPPASAFATDADDDKHADAAGPGAAHEVFKNLLPKMQQTARVQARQHANPFGQPNLIGFDPVALLVRDLVAVYRDSALFFHDVHGGRCIAGLWNPATAKALPFTASMDANLMPLPHEKVGTKPATALNRRAIVEEIIRLGEGLVEDVVIQNE
ncbi:U3 snoRNP protein [Coemansia erecta]|nr:U3 snoRNP protein [Coemansia erecta]